MDLTDLIEMLRIDLADPGSELFTDDELSRCIHKGAVILAQDLGQFLLAEDGEVKGDLDGGDREILLLLASIQACRIMRMKTANSFSFSSGDKRVDQTKQPEHWARLQADLELKYSDWYQGIFFDTKPVIFEQGGDL